MKEKGQLPTSEIIELDLSVEQMQAIASGLIPPPETTGIIAIPIGGGENQRRVRVTIQVKKIIAPDELNTICEANNESNQIEPALITMFNRIEVFKQKILLKSRWVIMGYITGVNEIPMVMFHYSMFNLTCYTLRINGDPEFIDDLKKLFNISPY